MSPSIPTVPLNDKRAIPAIAFGTGSALFGKDATTAVVQALEGGFSHIDTAQAYRNEESVGEALRQAFGKSYAPYEDEKIDVEGQTLGSFRREDIWVTTKYGGSGNAEDALDCSLEKLGLPSVDLYLIHQPRWAPDLLKTWSELESAHVHGKAKSIGVSNFSVNELKLLVEHGKVIPSVNQIRFHPYNYHENIQLLDYAKKHGIVIESYGGLTPITRLPGGKLDGVLEKVAKRLGPKVTPGQVIFNWIRAKGVVIVTTTSREERIQEYLSIFDLPALTEDEIAAIDEAGKYPPAADTSLSNESVAARTREDLEQSYTMCMRSDTDLGAPEVTTRRIAASSCYTSYCGLKILGQEESANELRSETDPYALYQSVLYSEI